MIEEKGLRLYLYDKRLRCWIENLFLILKFEFKIKKLTIWEWKQSWNTQISGLMRKLSPFGDLCALNLRLLTLTLIVFCLYWLCSFTKRQIQAYLHKFFLKQVNFLKEGLSPIFHLPCLLSNRSCDLTINLLLLLAIIKF